MKKLYFVISAIPIFTFANPNRIGAIRFNKATVERIYLSPGLGSMVQFPCALEEVFVGRSDDLKVQISPTNQKVLLLNLKLNSSLPTNVLSRCSGESSVFVFDAIPSKRLHQDFVEIRASFGRPLSREGMPVDKTTRSINRYIIKPPVLVTREKSQ